LEEDVLLEVDVLLGADALLGADVLEEVAEVVLFDPLEDPFNIEYASFYTSFMLDRSTLFLPNPVM
jgi:hypothetical protein